MPHLSHNGIMSFEPAPPIQHGFFGFPSWFNVIIAQFGNLIFALFLFTFDRDKYLQSST